MSTREMMKWKEAESEKRTSPNSVSLSGNPQETEVRKGKMVHEAEEHEKRRQTAGETGRAGGAVWVRRLSYEGGGGGHGSQHLISVIHTAFT